MIDIGTYATYSGVLIDPGDIKPEQINLIDITHHLTNENRFGRALPFDIHYSVAEHSMYLAAYVYKTTESIELARCALMHDAAEAYLGDITTGLKRYLHDYKVLESKLDFTIHEKYNISVKHHDYISSLDKRIIMDEIRCLRPEFYHIYQKKGRQPLGLYDMALRDHPAGKVPKQVVYETFLKLCELWDIKDE